MPSIAKSCQHSADSARPIALSIRWIGPGEEKRLFAYSGIEGAQTVKLVWEQARRIVAGMAGICEIEILTMECADHTGRHLATGQNGEGKAKRRSSRSAATLDRRRKLLARADGFDQPDLRRARHRAAR
jgi:hypothetical protein